MHRDKLKLIGEVDKEEAFDETEFEKLWATEVVGVIAAKKSFKKLTAKDSNTKQEDF